MIFLQVSADSVNTSLTVNHTVNPWFVAEIILITCVIIWQLYLSGRIFFKIRELKSIFRNPLKVRSGLISRKDLNREDTSVDDIVFVSDHKIRMGQGGQNDDDSVPISITEAFGSETILRIRDYINKYLLNNYGAAVIFSIIRDFIDREADLKDEEISNSLPTPLYLGLASTMIGIICGLFAMPALDGGRFSEGIGALINGVKLAMLGSFTGLICTTVLTSFLYKKARKSLLEDKNKQISYLQARLLPELIKAEDTGVSGLKASLDRFARVATGISENILKAADQTGNNILSQQELIRDIGNLDILKISETNLELFRKLEENMASFGKFSEYIGLMGQISDNLKEFAGRTRNVDQIIAQIDQSLSDNKRLFQFLSSHFEKIEEAGHNALKAVDLADLSFKDAVEKLEQEIRSRQTILNNTASDADTKAREAIDNLNTSLKERIALLNKTVDDAFPRFSHLDQLERLQGMQEAISAGTEGINTLIDEVRNLSLSLNNNSIKLKLDSIEDLLSKRRSRSGHSSNQPGIVPRTRAGRILKRFQEQAGSFLRKRIRKK